MHHWFLLALLATAHTHAEQPAITPSAAVDANARVPQAHYDSAFTGYRPYSGQRLAPWREVNDNVHKAGGHIGIVRGAAVKPATVHPPEHKK